LGAIQTSDRLIGTGYFGECEAGRTTGVAAGHQIDSFNRSLTIEQRTHDRIGSGEIEIAGKTVLHGITTPREPFCDPGVTGILAARKSAVHAGD
jgi:hypothetical protein